MRGLICLISLIAFIAQQLVCCCGGVVAVHQQGCSGTVLHSETSSSEVTASARLPACGHHHAAGEEAASDSPSGDDSSPANHSPHDSHQHHLCVGTHLFYRVVDLTAAPDPWWFVSILPAAEPLEPGFHDLEFRLTEAAFTGGKHPPRAVLGVYLL